VGLSSVFANSKKMEVGFEGAFVGEAVGGDWFGHGKKLQYWYGFLDTNDPSAQV